MADLQALETAILSTMLASDDLHPIDDYLEIDAETRNIVIPSTELIFGVETDKDAERKYFKCPRIVGNNLDLSELSLRVHFENAAQEKDKYIVEDVTVDGDYVIFSWLLSSKVLKYTGSVYFAICAVRNNQETGELENAWNTALGVGTVLSGLEVDDLTEDEEMESRDVLQQLLDLMDSEATENVEEVQTEGATQVANVQNEAAVQIASVQSEGASQVETIETTGQNVLASIPEDYATISEQVEWNSRYLAPTVEQVAEDENIYLTDSADMPLIGLNVYGKSEQVTTNGAQLIPYPYVDTTKTSYGVVFTDNGDGSIKVSGTAETAVNFTLIGDYSGTTAVIEVPVGDVYIKDCIALIVRNDGSTAYVKEATTINDGDAIVCIYLQISAGTTVNTTYYPMINVGNEEISWEPYTGGKAAPNLDYPQEITRVTNSVARVTGKNLLKETDVDFVRDYYMDLGLYYPPGQYSFSAVVSSTDTDADTSTFMFYDGTADSVRSMVLDRSSDGERVSFNTTLARPFDHIKIYPSASWGLSEDDTVTLTDMQLEYGTEVTSFEESRIQDVTIPYELRSVGDVHDEVDFERGVYIQRINTFELTNTFVENESTNEMWIELPSGLSAPEDINTAYCLCTHFPGDTRQNVYKNASEATYRGVAVSKSALRIVDNVNFPDGSDYLNAWIEEQNTAGNSIVVQYVLATPIETPLNAEELEAFKALKTNYPISSVINSSGTSQRVVYATDTKTYIDNKFAELTASLT